MNATIANHGLRFVILATIFSAPLAADPTDGQQEADTAQDENQQNHLDGYAKAKWAGKTLLYKTTNGHWRRAEKLVVKKKQGAFLSQGGQRVPYQPGDVIFKTRSFGWYKSDAGEPPVAATRLAGTGFVPSPESKALIDAVRATGAQSVQGRLDPEITRMATRYAQSMARQQRQDGHAGWSQRFSYLLSQGGGGGAPSEITAQSWSDLGPSLEAHARSCVRSWLQSPGHRAEMMRYHGRYGYAMARGNNGVYYGVGIFAN